MQKIMKYNKPVYKCTDIKKKPKTDIYTRHIRTLSGKIVHTQHD